MLSSVNPGSQQVQRCYVHCMHKALQQNDSEINSSEILQRIFLSSTLHNARYKRKQERNKINRHFTAQGIRNLNFRKAGRLVA